jgi:hypothetical protein
VDGEHLKWTNSSFSPVCHARRHQSNLNQTPAQAHLTAPPGVQRPRTRAGPSPSSNPLSSSAFTRRPWLCTVSGTTRQTSPSSTLPNAFHKGRARCKGYFPIPSSPSLPPTFTPACHLGSPSYPVPPIYLSHSPYHYAPVCSTPSDD